jgi:hypothetical protein
MVREAMLQSLLHRLIVVSGSARSEAMRPPPVETDTSALLFAGTYPCLITQSYS